mmetsp:Transcript_342/g.906  ORF Transcript_342/g.906 Transcript_342/m.906 type:complete len:367 (-) Transcript_342:98-1198(-)
MRASRSITRACAVLSTAAASVQPLALSPLAPAAPAARAMATAAVQTDAHKKKRGRRASASTAAAASPKRSKATDVRLEPPANWRATWELIVELRADRTAVVDSMGTEAIAGESTKEERDFDALVSLMLSSQTKDTVNAATMKKLRAHGLSPRRLLETRPARGWTTLPRPVRDMPAPRPVGHARREAGRANLRVRLPQQQGQVSQGDLAHPAGAARRPRARHDGWAARTARRGAEDGAHPAAGRIWQGRGHLCRHARPPHLQSAGVGGAGRHEDARADAARHRGVDARRHLGGGEPRPRGSGAGGADGEVQAAAQVPRLLRPGSGAAARLGVRRQGRARGEEGGARVAARPRPLTPLSDKIAGRGFG